VAREEEVKQIMEALVIADDKIIGEIMAARGVWGEGQSARVQAAKALKNLADTNQLEKGEGSYYRIIGCKSTYQPHSVLLTKQLAEILKVYPESIIFRERNVPEIGVRPDGIILIKRENKGLVIILECLVNETETYYQSKVRAWESWDGALEYLSRLFGVKIPNFSIIPIKTGENVLDRIPRKE